MRAHQIERTSDELVQKLGRAPTESELVGRLGISVTEHRAFLDQYARAQVRSLEARLEYQGGPAAGLHDLIGDHSATDPAGRGDGRGSRAAGSGHRGTRRARAGSYHLLLLRRPYAEGDRKGPRLTEGRISQILHSALVRLRQNLAEESRLSENPRALEASTPLC